MTKINETLLEKLFINPQPQPSRSEVKQAYFALFERMYPCKEDFISFLSSQSIDRQYESAQVIIQKLCYHANFPPSYYALTDVIAVENYQEKNIRETDSHIPRDHFIHLVFLYLLGIYIFFYNTEFYNTLLSLNRFERLDFSLGIPSIAGVKDFLSEWKYFCIYHDVGYPAEILGSSSQYSQVYRNKCKIIGDLSKEQTEFRASMGNGKIIKQQSFFSALEILSKLLFTKMVIESSHETIDSSHKFFRFFKNKNLDSNLENNSAVSFSDIDEKLYSGVVLEKIYSNKCLKTIAPVIGQKRISVVGIEKKSATVCFVSFNDGEKRRLVFTSDLKRNTEFAMLINNPTALFFDDYISEYFDFIFVLRKDEEIPAFNGLVDYKNFQTVYEKIVSEFENSYRAVSSEARFLDFSFEIFRWLLSKIRNDFEGTKLCEYVERQFDLIKSDRANKDSQVSKYDRNNQIRSVVFSNSSKYEKLMVSKNQELFSFFTEKAMGRIGRYHDLDELIKASIKQYKKAASFVVNSKRVQNLLEFELKKSIVDEIEGELAVLQLFTQMYIDMMSVMNTNKTMFCFDYIRNTYQFPDFLVDKIHEKVQKRIGYTSLHTLKNDYILKHGITVDHGMASASYAASVFECYRIAIESAVDADDRTRDSLLSILLDIPEGLKKSKMRYIDNYEHVLKNVLYSIFVHNLYPGHFKEGSIGKDYRIHISDPFTYLSLLCDVLQTWNRPKSLRKTMMGYKYFPGASESFNIEVREDKIVVSDHGTANKSWTSDFIASMREYLSNIDAFVVEG